MTGGDQGASAGVRRPLPAERKSITHSVVIQPESPLMSGAQIELAITVGLYEDGTPGELFVTTIGEPSGMLSGLLDGAAIAVSVALQHGAPLELLSSKLVAARFWPFGSTTNPEIPRCTSPLDYIFRWMRKKFAAA